MHDFQITHRQFYFIRHGQTDWNLIRKLQGSSDIALNETGISQAHEAKDRLAGVRFKGIYSSPMKRAQKTAQIIALKQECQITTLEDLREWHFGSSEGALYFDWLKELFNGDDTNVPDDVEPIASFMARTTGAINQALQHEGPVLIVAHGGSYIPARNCLASEHQQGLLNCQPVRHDPPNEGEPYWRKQVL